MRIALQIYGDINTLSGGYLYDRRLVSYLQSQGDSVEIISLVQRTYWQQCIINTSPQTLLDGGFDVIIQDELIHPAAYRMNRIFRRHCNTPLVALVHLLTTYTPHPAYKTWLYRHIESRYLRSVSGLILNSENTLNQVREMMHNQIPPCTVAVPAGNNFPWVKTVCELAPFQGTLKILYVGSVIRQKGLHVLLHALADLPREKFRLTVTGRQDMEPGYVNDIKQMIVSLQLQDQVIMTGPLTGADLVNMYTSHHVFVLPSENEAYGIVYLEAQQFGLPVIGTSAGGAREIIVQDRNGFLITPGDSHTLAQRLQQLYQDQPLLQKMSGHAHETYQTHPTWEDSGARVRRFLLELTGRKTL